MMKPNGEVTLKDDHIEIDHLVVCRVFHDNGKIMLQFFDRNKRRSADRGSAYVTIALEDFAQSIRNTLTVDF